jgi:hypothetical protein
MQNEFELKLTALSFPINCVFCKHVCLVVLSAHEHMAAEKYPQLREVLF